MTGPGPIARHPPRDSPGAQASPGAIVVAIDGPSGVGKSSVARRVAQCLGLPFLDTGAMYRCVAWVALQQGIDLADAAAVAALARSLPLELDYSPQTGTALLLHGTPVGNEIRTVEVSMATSEIARHAGVREHLLALQRAFGRRFGGVLEGRDIGTVVFPETDFKFYLDANLEVRARRRTRQLLSRGEVADVDGVAADLERRDRSDSERESAPLRLDSSYVVVDTSTLDEDQVVERLVELVEKIRGD